MAADDPERLVVTVVVRGASFVIGVVAAILINWLLWPFVARHELQKAVASMMFFLSILYRSKSRAGRPLMVHETDGIGVP